MYEDLAVCGLTKVQAETALDSALTIPEFVIQCESKGVPIAESIEKGYIDVTQSFYMAGATLYQTNKGSAHRILNLVY